MDGIDWMMVAEVVPITAGVAIIGALGALPPAALVVALALNGAMLGFAPFNRPVARLFMGDMGSLPVGLLIAWLLIVIAGFPGAFIGAFFAGSLLIETIFSLDGLGLLGFESIVNRDYPVVFATVYIFSLLGLVINLISDLTYTWVDPRIDFETREV